MRMVKQQFLSSDVQMTRRPVYLKGFSIERSLCYVLSCRPYTPLASSCVECRDLGGQKEWLRSPDGLNALAIPIRIRSKYQKPCLARETPDEGAVNPGHLALSRA